MTNMIKNFWKDEEGATAIEYGLIAGLISVVIIGVLTSMGEGLDGLFQKINTALGTAAGSGSGSGSGSGNP